MKKLFAFLAFCLLSSGLFAQEPLPEIPPPKPPLIAPPPENGAWTIKVHGGNAGGAAPTTSAGSAPQIDQVLCVKTGNLKRDIFTGSKGRRTELWYVGSMGLTKYENTDEIALVDAASFGPQTGTRTGSLTFGPGFPGFTWLSLSNYKNPIKIGDRIAYYYYMPPSESYKQIVSDGAGVKEETVDPKDELEAWIDVETKRPIAIKTGGVVYSYEFGQPPSAPLQLPAAFTETYKKHELQISRLKLLQK